jgi:hypothetical protein
MTEPRVRDDASGTTRQLPNPSATRRWHPSNPATRASSTMGSSPTCAGDRDPGHDRHPRPSGRARAIYGRTGAGRRAPHRSCRPTSSGSDVGTAATPWARSAAPRRRADGPRLRRHRRLHRRDRPVDAQRRPSLTRTSPTWPASPMPCRRSFYWPIVGRTAATAPLHELLASPRTCRRRAETVMGAAMAVRGRMGGRQATRRR